MDPAAAAGPHQHRVSLIMRLLGGLGREAERTEPHGVGRHAIGHLAAGQQESEQAALSIGQRVDLGRATASRAANGLIFSPPFLAPAACWWALMMVESTIR